ncbi:MAG: Gfo/Idh/MocA family oxidoreductase [Verrucomicrobiae bacterium]|nr:Gfo/Idh/MocA family oxidoreductase [Verrucomicrobiae bacterium]
MKNKLRVGVIGVGSVVREIYQHLYFHSDFTPMLDICAVADPNEQFRNWFCDLAKIPADRRFTNYKDMLAKVEMDAVQVNTPDTLHCAPAVEALKAGLDVVVPKPTAATIKDAHAMIETAKKTGRFMGIDFHKREDPRFKEAEARFQSGRYGSFQVAVLYMLDKLMVADPNHQPRFFASPDFATKNSPISFLTVHMADALMKVVNLIPIQVRAVGYSQKLPSLQPIAVKGYDMVDTEILFSNGATAHIITGWHLPNTAHSTTVQSNRLIFSDGMLDIGLDMPGYREIHKDGILEINPLFRNFEKNGLVTGYGISSPGRLYQQILARRNGQMKDDDYTAAMTPIALGFYTTLVLQGAEKSLEKGKPVAKGVTGGETIDLRNLLVTELGESAAKSYGM